MLTGGRVTLEDAYAYAKFARIALGTNDIDFRARPHSAEEAQFLAARRRRARASRSPTPTWRRRPPCCSSGFEPEEESPIVFLRLRKAWLKQGLKVYSIAPFATPGLAQDGRHADPHRAGRARPRRSATWSPARLAAEAQRSRVRSSWPASGWPPCPARCPRCRGWRRLDRRPAGLDPAPGR